MHAANNDRGSVIVLATLMIVLLLLMVGMGLDTGHLAYIRSQGQPAVDAAALAAYRCALADGVVCRAVRIGHAGDLPALADRAGRQRHGTHRDEQLHRHRPRRHGIPTQGAGSDARLVKRSALRR